MGKCIPVTAAGVRYTILLEPSLLQKIKEYWEENAFAQPTVVVTDTHVASLYGENLASLIKAGLIVIPPGEQAKTLATVAQLYPKFVALGLDRSSMVVALGGGVVGDLAGFAAATYLRGINLLHIPTTLLAMVDASIGGKVGLDLPQGKNLIGVFKQPVAVWIDPEVLQTLPRRELTSGLAEVIKHGLIADPELLKLSLLRNACSLELIQRAIQVKVAIVEKDPWEQNIREYLNLGHTFAHAIERVSEYQWMHGEAVAVGLLAATRLSCLLKLCHPSLAERVKDILVAVGLPCHLRGLNHEKVYAAMATDKKWRHHHSRFVVLHEVGDPLVIEDVPKSSIIKVLETLDDEKE